MTTAGQSPVAPSRLPDRLERYGIRVRRWDVDDVPALHAAIAANLDHLRPFMPWIAFEPQTLEQRRALVEGWRVRESGRWALGLTRGAAAR